VRDAVGVKSVSSAIKKLYLCTASAGEGGLDLDHGVRDPGPLECVRDAVGVKSVSSAIKKLYLCTASAGEGGLDLDHGVLDPGPLERVRDAVGVQEGERRVEELSLVREGAQLGDVWSQVHEGGRADAEEQSFAATLRGGRYICIYI